MPVILQIFRTLRQLYSNPKFRNVFTFLFFLLVLGTLGVYYFEHARNDHFRTLGDGLWWAFVTISTVGYGDKYPITTGGRLVGLMMMFGGIGTFGYLAGILIEDFIQRRKGEVKLVLAEHYIICHFSGKAKAVAEEILGEEKDARIVLVDECEENPLTEMGVEFISGDCADEETLKKASIEKARGIIVLASDRLDDYTADSHSVLTTLAIRHLNPRVKITAEALELSNEQHLRRAGASEVIISDRIVSRLIARSNFYDKSFNFIRDIVTSNKGVNIYDSAVPEDSIGKTYGEFDKQLREKQAAPMGLYRSGEIIPLPGEELKIQEGDHLIYVAFQKVL